MLNTALHALNHRNNVLSEFSFTHFHLFVSSIQKTHRVEIVTSEEADPFDDLADNLNDLLKPIWRSDKYVPVCNRRSG